MPRRRLQTWIGAVLRTMGPASSARAVYDRVAVPLFSELGFRTILTRADTDAVLRGVLHAGGLQAAVVLVTAWGREPGAAWRDAVLLGIGKGVRWCLCVNGPVVRVFDSRRTYSRRFVQFDLEVTIGHPDSFKLFWHLLQATAFSTAVPRLDRAVRISEEHRSDVRVSLQRGVHDALERLVSAFARAHGRRTLPPADVLFDESLTVLYRILFLLFAEARGLVPKWHPTYGDSYTIESLRLPIERQLRPKGVWEALQAISRLAHKGCRAGTLRVAAVQRSALFAQRGAAGIVGCAGRRGGAGGAAGVDYACRARGAAAHCVRGSRGRAAWRRVRAHPGFRPGMGTRHTRIADAGSRR